MSARLKGTYHAHETTEQTLYGERAKRPCRQSSRARPMRRTKCLCHRGVVGVEHDGQGPKWMRSKDGRINTIDPGSEPVAVGLSHMLYKILIEIPTGLSKG
jgi:hypothetical protein